MKRTIFIGIFTVLMITLFIGYFTAFAENAEKKVWGKQNKIANEIASSAQNLYINVIQVLEKGLNEELGDPDVLGKFKDDVTKKYNPELIPENLEDIEKFVYSFIDEIIDFHKYILEEEWADPILIEELKNKVLEYKPSAVRIPPSKVTKFQAWGINYPPRINLGITYIEVPLETDCYKSNLSSTMFYKYKEAAGTNPASLIVLKSLLPGSPLSKAILVEDTHVYGFGNPSKGDTISVLTSNDQYSWVLAYIDDQFIYSKDKFVEILDELKPGEHTFTFHSESGWLLCKVKAIL